MRSGAASRVIRLAAGVGLLVWLIAWVDWRQLAAAVQRCNPWWAGLGFTAFALSTIPAALRARVLFHRLALSVGAALRITLSSYFFNQLLPTGVGGDAYRSIRLKDGSGGWISSIGLLVFERAASALSLVVPALFIAVADRDNRLVAELRGAIAQALTTGRLLALGGVILAVAVIASLTGIHHRVRTRHEVVAIMRDLSAGTIFGVVGLSLLFHAARIAGMAAFLESAGFTLALDDLVLVMALTLFASMVPVSIGALGVREGILVYALGAYGVPNAEALTVALLARLVVIALGAAGGVLFHGDRVSEQGLSRRLQS